MRVKPSGEAIAFQAIPGVFDSRHPLERARSSAAERRFDKADAAGAIPAARTVSVRDWVEHHRRRKPHVRLHELTQCCVRPVA
jgi:hypothetical protein